MNNKSWLLAILILGGLLRLWGLGSNPPGLYWDEVSLGWNAYSILKTGMDEHGRFFPIDTFYAFGDYKPPAYIYAVVPTIFLFGLNEFAIRLPSALAGIGLIFITYLLGKELFNKKIGFIASWLIATSPWSLMLSRAGFESNLATSFNALGVLFFLWAVRKNPRWLFLAIISFVLATYTFNANRVISPLLLTAMSLIYFNKALKNWKIWTAGVALGILLILPMIGHLRSPQGKLRWQEVNIFSDLKVVENSNNWRQMDNYSWRSKIIHHRYWGYTSLFLSHYLDHFSLNYLFLDGDPNPRLNIPNTGEMYLIELPFLVIGLICLFKINKFRTISVLGVWWLLAVIPAGMARETPHALRSASVLPVPQIITAIGLIWLIRQIRRIGQIRIRRILLFLFGFMFLASLLYYQFIYWRNYPREWAGEWLTGYKPLVKYISEIQNKYQTVYVTPDLGRPYVYFLFYNQFDPKKYIDEAKSGGRTGDAFGFFNVKYFNKYRFFIPDLENVSRNDLVVLRSVTILPAGFKLINVINGVNGYPEFSVLSRE